MTRLTPRLVAALLLVWLATSSAAHAEELRAGLGVADLPTPNAAPLGGYGGLTDRNATGVIDPPQARALVLEQRDTRVALVSVDVVIARADLSTAVREGALQLGLELDDVLVAATHTHSGPGGYIEGFLAERLTGGDFDPKLRDGLVRAVLDALRAAVAELHSVTPAATQGEVDLAVNRRYADGPRERALPVLVLRSAAASPSEATAASPSQDSAPPIALFAYGAHPTVLSPQNERYSADYVGAAREWLERNGTRAIFLAGPLGDQGPRPPQTESGLEGVERELRWSTEQGESLGRAVDALTTDLGTHVRSQLVTTLRVVSRDVELPPYHARHFCALWWLSPLVSGSAQRILSPRVTLRAYALGNARILAVPAEPTSALGSELRAAIAEQFPDAPAFVVAHAGDWSGYALTTEGYERGGYEACLSFRGAGFGPLLVSESRELLAALAKDLP